MQKKVNLHGVLCQNFSFYSWERNQGKSKQHSNEGKQNKIFHLRATNYVIVESSQPSLPVFFLFHLVSQTFGGGGGLKEIRAGGKEETETAQPQSESLISRGILILIKMGGERWRSNKKATVPTRRERERKRSRDGGAGGGRGGLFKRHPPPGMRPLRTRGWRTMLERRGGGAGGGGGRWRRGGGGGFYSSSLASSGIRCRRRRRHQPRRNPQPHLSPSPSSSFGLGFHLQRGGERERERTTAVIGGCLQTGLPRTQRGREEKLQTMKK